MWINEEAHVLLEPQEEHHCHLLCKTAAEYHSLLGLAIEMLAEGLDRLWGILRNKWKSLKQQYMEQKI